MPRSNKKKFPHKPPAKHPTTQAIVQPTTTIKSLFSDERKKMISRSIISARHHGIHLKHGRSNPGTGDCALQSVIQNINDRSTFQEHFPLATNYYRRIWAIDMANRTVDTDWNIFSREEWLKGWQDMMIPGTYERGIYGDLMLPAIACGVKKVLLIFNTNPETPHDPIYVVDPMQFNIPADSDKPIILAYNMSHYESMHPYGDDDVRATADLVKEYLENRYRFNKHNFSFLLDLDEEAPPNKIPKLIESSPRESRCATEKTKCRRINKSSPELAAGTKRSRQSQQQSRFNEKESDTGIDLEEIDDFLDVVNTTFPKKTISVPETKKMESKHKKAMLDSHAADKRSSEDIKANLPEANLCYRLKNKTKKYPFIEVDGKLKCPFCSQFLKNINLHFSKNLKCEEKIDKVHFKQIFEEHVKKKQREIKIRITRTISKTKVKNLGLHNWRETNKIKETSEQGEKRKVKNLGLHNWRETNKILETIEQGEKREVKNLGLHNWRKTNKMLETSEQGEKRKVKNLGLHCWKETNKITEIPEQETTRLLMM